jgi:archaellum component FlaC
VPGLPYAERETLLFNLQVDRLKASPDAQQQLYKKEQTLRREINELENDISTLKTNLEFFARSKNAAQLREEYQGRIDEAQRRIEALKKQLRVVRS